MGGWHGTACTDDPYLLLFSPVIGFVSNSVYSLLVSLRLCSPAPPRAYAYDLESQGGRSSSPLPGSARAEAERRR